MDHFIIGRNLIGKKTMVDDHSAADEAAPAKRRGRPRLYDAPLSQAERAKRYRKARQWDESSLDDCRDPVLMDRLSWALKHKDTSEDARGALDIYLEELVRRHHSKGKTLFK